MECEFPRSRRNSSSTAVFVHANTAVGETGGWKEAFLTNTAVLYFIITRQLPRNEQRRLVQLGSLRLPTFNHLAWISSLPDVRFKSSDGQSGGCLIDASNIGAEFFNAKKITPGMAPPTITSRQYSLPTIILRRKFWSNLVC